MGKAIVWIIVIGGKGCGLAYSYKGHGDSFLSAIYKLYILPHPTSKPHHRGSKKLLDKKGIICSGLIEITKNYS